jgi:hypothetical protein
LPVLHLRPTFDLYHMSANSCVTFNSSERYARKLESYGLMVCEFEASQKIAEELNKGAEPQECMPLVRLVFIRRNGTFRCSSLYDGDVCVDEVRKGFFDEMTRAEKLEISAPGFTFYDHYQRRANMFHKGAISAKKKAIAQKADQRWKAIMAVHRAELARSTRDGPHGVMPLSMPKGRITRGGELETAIKETREETGIHAHQLNASSKTNVTVDYVDDNNRYVFKFFPALLTRAHRLVLDRDTPDMYDEVTGLFYANKEELAARELDPLTKKIYLEHFDTFAATIVSYIADQQKRPPRRTFQSDAETVRSSPVSWLSSPHCSPQGSPLSSPASAPLSPLDGEWLLPAGLLDDDPLDLSDASRFDFL